LISITQAVSRLTTNPTPILCLDTCDFLDVVRSFTAPDLKEANLFHAQSFRKALLELTTQPDRFQVVITYLVRHEWTQNIEEARQKVDRHLLDVNRRLDLIVEACGLVGVPVATVPPRLSSIPLTSGLINLAEGLMNQAIVIEKDVKCVERALERVMDRKRPSHKKEIKDSIHWEHYLELSRALETAGHTQDRLFVSANKADFWVNRDTPAIHPDLEDEAHLAGLRFFGRLDEALRSLGI
jgi:hypothetical protein